MEERYTPATARVLHLASEEAKMLGHTYVGTEHLLLGLLHEAESLAFAALCRCGVELDSARVAVTTTLGVSGCSVPLGAVLPLTPRARNAKKQMMKEALYHGHIYVGPEHLLLALLRESHCGFSRSLTSLDVGAEQLRAEVLELLVGR